MAIETHLSTPQGHFNLKRWPQNNLRAWDAADEYLLSELEIQQRLQQQNRILILNDGFGALSVALNQYRPTSISDSYMAQSACLENIRLNQIDETRISMRGSLDWPESGLFDLILIKIPKTLALLEDQLIQLRPLLHENSQVIAAAMIKALPEKAWRLIQQYIGACKPSLTKKKSRLIYAEFESRPIADNPYPERFHLDEYGFDMSNHANVFSRSRLDIGSRFFIQHLPVGKRVEQIIDLGCGNGILGLIMGYHQPETHIHFVDESHMAIASAKTNIELNCPKINAEFHLNHCLTGFKKDSADLILCNPPFHQQQMIGYHIAYLMFKQSARVLKTGAELWIVANRHLNYSNELNKLFQNVSIIASNSKFNIIQCIK